MKSTNYLSGVQCSLLETLLKEYWIQDLKFSASIFVQNIKMASGE